MAHYLKGRRRSGGFGRGQTTGKKSRRGRAKLLHQTHPDGGSHRVRQKTLLEHILMMKMPKNCSSRHEEETIFLSHSLVKKNQLYVLTQRPRSLYKTCTSVFAFFPTPPNTNSLGEFCAVHSEALLMPAFFKIHANLCVESTRVPFFTLPQCFYAAGRPSA